MTPIWTSVFVISARAQAGANGGNVAIAGDNAFIIALPLNNSNIIATADDGTGRGGLPAAPTNLPNNTDPWEDWFIIESQNLSSSPAEISLKPSEIPFSINNDVAHTAMSPHSDNVYITEAQGWLRAEHGISMLVTADILTPTNGNLQSLDCRHLKTIAP